MNFFEGVVSDGCVRCGGFDYPLSPEERVTLGDYEGKAITLGVRPENAVPGDTLELTVSGNENLGQTTLLHGNICGGKKITCKFREWCNYKFGDKVSISFNRMHFFDKETTNAIR